MIKLTRRLFALGPDVSTRSSTSRRSSITSSVDGSGDGTMCYMVPVGRRAARVSRPFRSFTCCVGSGMESHALHGLGLYYESGDRLWVNLYAPSTARWEAAGVSLDMATTFPEGESASLTLTAACVEAVHAGAASSVVGRRRLCRPRQRRVSPRICRSRDLDVELKRTWKTGDPRPADIAESAAARFDARQQAAGGDPPGSARPGRRPRS